MTTLRNSIVSAQETEALKEMIFKRARERAEAINKDVQESFTDSVQNDVMNIARESFVATKNPFSQIVNQNTNINTSKDESHKEDAPKIGFTQKNSEEVKKQIHNKLIHTQEAIMSEQVQNTMLEARNGLNKKTNFIGALDFLNAQASIALINKKTKKFEAIA